MILSCIFKELSYKKLVWDWELHSVKSLLGTETIAVTLTWCGCDPILDIECEGIVTCL